MPSQPSNDAVLHRYRFARGRLAVLKRDGGSERQLRQAERHVRYCTDQLIRACRTPTPLQAPVVVEAGPDTVAWSPALMEPSTAGPGDHLSAA